MERFLYRLSQSKFAEKFILKGALMFHVWDSKNVRATRDIDFLGYFENELDSVATIIREICETESNDGLIFDSKNLKTLRIKEDAEYEGVRVTFVARLSSAKIPMQLDIGFGDEVNPKPQYIKYPALLGDELPIIRGYPRETVVAEKFQAMVQLGEFNSRLKDFYDIWFLARGFAFDGVALANSIQKTFDHRNTKIESAPIALSSEFSERADKQAMWAAFLKRSRLGSTPESLKEITDSLSQFLMPIVKTLVDEKSFEKNWNPPGPWK